MDFIISLFDLNNIFYEFPGYKMSYLELIGTVFYLLSVYLIVIKNLLTWPTGIISSILYMILFYKINLYADSFAQFYFIFVSLYGWYTWEKEKKKKNTISVFFSPRKIIIMYILLTIVLTFGLFLINSNIHIIAPGYFPEKAAYPLADSFTTIMSFVAIYLMSERRIESWIYWMIVDIVSSFVYWFKGIKLLSIQFFGLFLFAGFGYYLWIRKNKLK
ncbi:MAG: nicotinamide mononucleotide transporter [Leptospiraceae bacterium]|nr:nicotinamide mononucleotide transporter [Leptospiraceae bacterium]